MRPIILCILLTWFLSTLVVQGQDVIVTIAGDSIFCQVEETNERFIYYTTPKSKRGRVEVISRRQVRDILTDQRAARRRPVSSGLKDREERFSFYGGGGISWWHVDRLEDSDDFDEYYKSLQWGRWLGFGASYMLDSNLGVGVFLSRSTFSSDRVGVQAQNGALTGFMREEVTIDYAAVNLTYRFGADPSGSGFALSGGIGVTRYRNDFEIFFPFYLEGYDVGLHAKGIYRLAISPNIFIPIEIGVRGLTVGTINIMPDDGVPDNLQNPLRNYIATTHPAGIGRVEFGVGLEIAF